MSELKVIRRGKPVDVFVNGEKVEPVKKTKLMETMSRRELDELIDKKRKEARDELADQEDTD